MKRYFFGECRTLRGELAAFESGELAPERAERVAAHLATCQRCRNDWEAISGVATMLRTEPPRAAEPASDLWNRIESQLLEPVPVPTRPLWRRPAFPLALAGPALAATVVFVTARNVPPSASPEATPRPPVTVTARPTAPQMARPVTVAIAKVEPEPDPVAILKAAEAERARPVPVETVRPVRRSKRLQARDPFAPLPVVKVRRPSPKETPRPERAPMTVANATVVVGSDEVRAAGTLSSSPEVRPELDATVVPVGRPTPAATALRDARIDAESVERRSAAAMEAPLDAVDRASRARRLFP